MSAEKGFDRGYRSEGGGLPVNMINEYFSKQDTSYNTSYPKELQENLDSNNHNQGETLKKAINNKAITFKQRVESVLKK